jgi:hypothetical protein
MNQSRKNSAFRKNKTRKTRKLREMTAGGLNFKSFTAVKNYWAKNRTDSKNHLWMVSHNLNYILKSKNDNKFATFTELKKAILAQLKVFKFNNVTDKFPEGITVTYN